MNHIKPKILQRILILLGFLLLVFVGIKMIKKTFKTERAYASDWFLDYDLVNIPSTLDYQVQKAYIYKSTANTKQPVIISLHTWNGDYSQNDYLHHIVKSKNWNYIHPDFRGPNSSFESCASDLVISDIDDAISYALAHLNADANKIYVIGNSGGAYATLGAFMKSKHKIAAFSAWCPISDLHTWHDETKSRGIPYYQDILKCTNSINGNLNVEEAIKRSPLHWSTPQHKISEMKSLKLFAGVFDGQTGTVPITQSINFYNKLLKDYNCENPEAYFTKNETDSLLKFRNRYNSTSNKYLGSRKVILNKQYKTISLTIFDGTHEILTDIAIDELINP